MPIIKRLTNPTEEEVNYLRDLLTRAFADDPTVLIFVGGNASLFPEYLRAFVRATCLEGETYIVIDEETNDIATIMSWFPPGRSLFDSATQRALGFDEVYAKFPKETRDWHEVTYPAERAKIEEQFFTKEELSQRWFCYGLATDPKHQRKGYATAALLDFRQKLKDIDPELSSAVSGSAEGNIEFYKKVGFELLVQRRLPAPVGTGGDIPFWFMSYNKPARKT